MNGEGIDIYGVSAAARKIKDIVIDLSLNGYSRVKPFAMGRVEQRMTNYAKSKGITLASKSIYMSSHSIAHSLRNSKSVKGKTISLSALVHFPRSRSRMDLYYDGEVFVYTDYKSKFIIHPNYELKINRNKVRKVNYITATKVVDKKEFNGKRYTKIQKD